MGLRTTRREIPRSRHDFRSIRRRGRGLSLFRTVRFAECRHCEKDFRTRTGEENSSHATTEADFRGENAFCAFVESAPAQFLATRTWRTLFRTFATGGSIYVADRSCTASAP